MLAWWTIGRAGGLGVTALLVGVVLWAVPWERGEILFWVFAAAAAVAGLCGVSILAITLFDTLVHRRGRRIRPVRVFDVVLGLALVAFSLLQLQTVAGRLPA